MDQRLKVEFEQRCYQYAREAVVALRSDMSDAQYLELLRELRDAHADGDFALEGKRGMKAVKTARGGLLLLCLLTGATEDEAVALLSAMPAEVSLMLETVMRASFPGITFKKKGDAAPSP